MNTLFPIEPWFSGRLRPHDKQNKACIYNFIPVNRRSLYVIKHPARSEWQHNIAPVNEVHYSITLRTLRKVVTDGELMK